MNKVKIFLFFLICFLSINVNASWRVFVYMDSSDDLSDMAIKNISDMLAAQPNDTVEMRIQLHAYDNVAYRYQVSSNALVHVDTIILTSQSDQDLIDGAAWGFEDCEQDYTMAIVWNHGWGILDPHWDEISQEWIVDDMGTQDCPVKRSIFDQKHIHQNHKGFMFSKEPRAYLNNQELVRALETIKQEILQGRKLDVLAFDTCMGAMLEVAYQVADYAHYLVGNQTCALVDGYNYQGIISALNSHPTPREMATSMVRAFDDYYSEHDQAGIYAHSAIDIEKVEQVRRALDEFLVMLLEARDCDAFVLNAALKSPRFCLFPMYTDLIAFLKNIEEQLDVMPSSSLKALKKSLHAIYAAMNECVVACCAGYTMQQKTHGLSVYLPNSPIDRSYFNTLFAQNSKWLSLLGIIEKDISASCANL